MTYDEYMQGIANRKEGGFNDSTKMYEKGSYPVVVTTSDPMLIRFDEMSLLVNDTNFWAKIKTGIKWSGFMIYVSGISTPVYECKMSEDVVTQQEVQVPGGNTAYYRRTQKSSESYIRSVAKEWLDVLEATIATTNADNGIKKAIDRLNWQLHYDITKTNTTDDYAIENYDLSQGIKIDRPVPFTGSGTQPTHEVGYSVVDSTQYVTKCLCSPNQVTMYDSTVIPAGALVTLYTRLAGVNEYSISRCLRDKDDTSYYRPDDPVKSVACEITQQTYLESAEFTEISVNQLGRFGSTYKTGVYNNKTLFDALGDYGKGADPIDDRAVSSDLGTYGDSVSDRTLFGQVGSASGANATSIISRLGQPGNEQTIWGTVDTINGTVNTINGNVGDKGQGGTVIARIGASGDTGINTLFGYSNTINSGVNGVSGQVTNVSSAVSSVSGKVDTVSAKIGTPSDNETVLSVVNTIDTHIGTPYANERQTIFGMIGNKDDTSSDSVIGSLWYRFFEKNVSTMGSKTSVVDYIVATYHNTQ